eukprot:gene3612-13697_t
MMDDEEDIFGDFMTTFDDEDVKKPSASPDYQKADHKYSTSCVLLADPEDQVEAPESDKNCADDDLPQEDVADITDEKNAETSDKGDPPKPVESPPQEVSNSPDRPMDNSSEDKDQKRTNISPRENPQFSTEQARTPALPPLLEDQAEGYQEADPGSPLQNTGPQPSLKICDIPEQLVQIEASNPGNAAQPLPPSGPRAATDFCKEPPQRRGFMSNTFTPGQFPYKGNGSSVALAKPLTPHPPTMTLTRPGDTNHDKSHSKLPTAKSPLPSIFDTQQLKSTRAVETSMKPALVSRLPAVSSKGLSQLLGSKQALGRSEHQQMPSVMDTSHGGKSASGPSVRLKTPAPNLSALKTPSLIRPQPLLQPPKQVQPDALPDSHQSHLTLSTPQAQTPSSDKLLPQSEVPLANNQAAVTTNACVEETPSMEKDPGGAQGSILRTASDLGCDNSISGDVRLQVITPTHKTGTEGMDVPGFKGTRQVPSPRQETDPVIEQGTAAERVVAADEPAQSDLPVPVDFRSTIEMVRIDNPIIRDRIVSTKRKARALCAE